MSARAAEQTTRPVRIPASDDRPDGDQYWQGYVPRAHLFLDGGDPDELAAAGLEGTAPVSHPLWCSWERCDVWDHGSVMHVADAGAGDASERGIGLIRHDFWDEDAGCWQHGEPELFDAPHPIPDSLITEASRARILPVIDGGAR